MGQEVMRREEREESLDMVDLGERKWERGKKGERKRGQDGWKDGWTDERREEGRDGGRKEEMEQGREGGREGTLEGLKESRIDGERDGLVIKLIMVIKKNYIIRCHDCSRN